MLLKTNGDILIDSIKINFDTEGLWILNIALAVIMFGVALSIKIDDFKLSVDSDSSEDFIFCSSSKKTTL